MSREVAVLTDESRLWIQLKLTLGEFTNLSICNQFEPDYSYKIFSNMTTIELRQHQS